MRAGDEVGVKVVYNGFDLTEHIPTCQAAATRVGKTTDGPCPIHIFKEQVDSLLMGESSFHNACALDASTSSESKGLAVRTSLRSTG